MFQRLEIPMNSFVIIKKSTVCLFYVCFQMLPPLRLFRNCFLPTTRNSSCTFYSTKIWSSTTEKRTSGGDIGFLESLSLWCRPISEGRLKIRRRTIHCYKSRKIVNGNNPIQLNWASVPFRWESGRVLDACKETDHNSEIGQVMLEVATFQSVGAILQLSQPTCHKFHDWLKRIFCLSFDTFVSANFLKN